MRIIAGPKAILDTKVDTRKKFVPMNYRFVLRNYVNKLGLAHVYLHATQPGKDRFRHRLDIEVEPKFWDAKKQRVKDSHPRAKELNLQLLNEESKITTIKTNYHLAGVPLTLDLFAEEYINGAQRTDFVAFMKSQLELDKPSMNPNTYKAQLSVYRKLQRFRKSILFSEITEDLIKRFKNHIIKQGHATTTMNNNLKVIKKYLIRAQDRGLWFPLNTKSIKCGPTDGNRVDLDGDEVRRLVEYFKSDFLRPNHKVPLARFLFSCFTGTRISDVQQMTENHFSYDHITFTSIKTGKRQKLAINLSVRGIFELCPEIFIGKYTDQQINRVLKDIAQMVGITKKVTFHVARHSFATNHLRLGGSIRALQKILGHSNINQTMVYVHIVQEELDREMMIIDRMLEKNPISPLQNRAVG